MQEIIKDVFSIVMSGIMGYIVWMLQTQKKDRDANSKDAIIACPTHRIS